ncbi:unnamed protein product [Caenorhabditis sp. 36 PRJEB53466]|nr:unnamed protein product [Caenorhabditis sp. 36 PRJEB53466]
MISPLRPVLFLLLVGTTSAGIVFSRNADGSFSAVPNNAAVFEEHADGSDEHTQSLVDALESNIEKDFETNISTVPEHIEQNDDHVAHSPLDDEDMDLVHEFIKDRQVNKTGQLRYSALATVEKAMISDIIRLIMKNDEYMLLLNKPRFPDLVFMIKDMIRAPTQEVLRRQVWSKLLAVQAHYKKLYEKYNNEETKSEAMGFLEQLQRKMEADKLNVNDTINLNLKMKTLAYLMQEKVFGEKVSELEEMLNWPERKSSKIRKSVASTTTPKSSSTTLAPKNSTQEIETISSTKSHLDARNGTEAVKKSGFLSGNRVVDRIQKATEAERLEILKRAEHPTSRNSTAKPEVLNNSTPLNSTSIPLQTTANALKTVDEPVKNGANVAEKRDFVASEEDY